MEEKRPPIVLDKVFEGVTASDLAISFADPQFAIDFDDIMKRMTEARDNIRRLLAEPLPPRVEKPFI
jgi:hypothetical protein